MIEDRGSLLSIFHSPSSILDDFRYSLHARRRKAHRLDDFIEVIIQFSVMRPIDERKFVAARDIFLGGAGREDRSAEWPVFIHDLLTLWRRLELEP